MKTLEDLKNFRHRAAAQSTLSINGVNVCELAATNPTDAYDLVFNEVNRRGGFKAFHAYRQRQCEIQKAMQKPLPGAAGDAFTRGPMTVNKRTVYAVVPTHFRCLQAVDSPLLKLYERAMEQNGNARKDFNESEEWEICYIFTTPPRQLRKLFESGGAEAIKNASANLCECIDAEHPGWTAAEINMTVLAAVAQITEHAKTTVAFEAEAESSGTTFFRELRASRDTDTSKPAGSEKSSPTSPSTENTSPATRGN